MKSTIQRPVTPRFGASEAVATPIYPSVVYAADTPDGLDGIYDSGEGFTYAREGHPNAEVLAARIATLEGVERGIVTGSGMAAVAAVLLGLPQAGNRVVGGDQLYGRSLRMMAEDLPRMGVETALVDPTDAAAVRRVLAGGARLMLVELVSNPTLRVADFEAIAEACREAGALLVVDNTFTTPLAFRPFDHGADIVLHSVTKLLAGHSDATLGWVAARDPEVQARLEVFVATAGMTPSPFDCWLAERGLASFDLRFARAQETARALADWLGGQDGVARVLYPGRADHPDHNRARVLLGENAGNMVSFEITGGRAAANAFASGCAGVAFAPTLGDVGTTLSHAASSSHRAMSPEARAAIGISEGFFRVSVGLEDPDALIAAFAAGLAAARAL